jgi:hypothetical protein
MTESSGTGTPRFGWRGRVGGTLALWAGVAMACSVGDEPGPSFGFGSGPPSASGSADPMEPDDGDGTDDSSDADGWPGGSEDTGGAETTGDPVQPLGSCCEASAAAGCATAGIEACVCEHDASCCQDRWSATCVKQVETLGCGKCPGGADDGGAPAGECCQAHGMPGCVDAAVETCVCAQDASCCQAGWDATCVQAVDALGCGTCGGGGGGGGGAGCCSPQAGSGCGDFFVEACVCLWDPYCCFVEWDEQCVQAVTELGCGAC